MKMAFDSAIADEHFPGYLALTLLKRQKKMGAGNRRMALGGLFRTFSQNARGQLNYCPQILQYAHAGCHKGFILMKMIPSRIILQEILPDQVGRFADGAFAISRRLMKRINGVGSLVSGTNAVLCADSM
jgi:hypothetical protein